MRALKRSLSEAWAAAREQAPLLSWVAFLAWEAWGLRTTLTTRHTSASFVDDAAFVLLFTAIYAGTERLPRSARVPLQLVVALAAATGILIDTLHYRFFGTFLNVESVLLAGQMGAAATSVWELITPEVWAFGIGVPLGLVALAVRGSLGFTRRRRHPWPWAAIVGSLLLLAIQSPLAAGIEAASFNNPFMLFARQALGGGAGEDMTDEEIAAELAAHVEDTFNWPPTDAYRRGTDPGFPLLKVPVAASGPRRRHNVVVLLMESVRAYETGLAGDGPSVTPNIDRLAQRGLTVTDFYAVGHQTVRGEGSLLCGTFTHQGGAPIYVRYPNVRIMCLPEILRDLGYTTHWISSFRKDYFNKQEFLSQHGVDLFHDMREVPRAQLERGTIGWGPADEDMMAYAVRVLDDSRAPFFANVMTLSNHHPFHHGYPIAPPAAYVEGAGEGGVYRDYLRGTHYTDHAIGRFFELARRRPWFRDTIFVITGDHGTMEFPRALDAHRDPAQQVEMFYRSPLVIVGPDVPARRLDVVGSQMDVAPTILDLLGVRAANAFMGVSLLADLDPAARFAVMASANEWHVRRGDRYCYAIGGTQCLEDGHPACGDEDPVPAEHSCFETSQDLLDIHDERVGPSMRLLPPPEAAELELRGARVVRFTNHLLRTERYYPWQRP